MNPFTLERAGEHFWIRHAGRRVLLFVRMPTGTFCCNAVFLRPPGAPEPELPPSYHSATAIGLQADFRWRWGADWRDMECAAVALSESEARLKFSRRQASGRGEQQIEMTLRGNHERAEGYVLHVSSRLIGDMPAGQSIEFLNFLPADAGNSWPERKRFRATVHEKAPGQFETRPHSQLSVIEQYYWPDAHSFRASGREEPPFAQTFRAERRAEGADAPYAVSHLFKPLAPGGVLYFAGEAVAPAVRVLGTNAPVVLHTCDVWYDEHLCLAHGIAQPDGRSCYEAEYELFAVPTPEAERAAATATEVEWSRWVRAESYPAFFCGRVNNFVTPAARSYDGSSGLFFAGSDPRELVSWQRAGAADRAAIVLNTLAPLEPPSGQHYQAVRYDLKATRPWAEAFPLGFALHINPGEQLYFAALVRTEGDAVASLEMREAFWGRFHQEHAEEPRRRAIRTAEVRNEAWTEVGAVLTAEIPGSLAMVFLKIEGRGRAWFTDLVVSREPVHIVSI